ncbi:HET domain-containing protein [Thozetella sp. PMI_491]|nr:HET domain-containing protein [Thozetella sp. PMI_491]
MDHLPVFRHMVEAYSRIPVVSREPYDGLPFAEYHHRRGFNVTRLYERDYGQHSPDETASFIQTWLFFGALHEIFGFQSPIDMGQFIETDHLGRRLCTRHLESCIATWAAQIEALAEKSPSDCRAALTKVGVVQNTLNRIYHGLSNATDSPVPTEVTLSLGILGCTIDHALKWLWGLGRGRKWGLDSLAASRMSMAEWCPRDIAVSRQLLSELPMLCASYLERRAVPFDHWGCSETTCQVNQIDNETYKTQHRTKDCQCEHICPDQSEIRRILDKGGVPVIYVTSSAGQNGGPKSLRVEVSEGSTFIHSYTAISHVWSDGLGNPKANSLPLCQIEFLYDRLSDMIMEETYSALETSGQDIEYDSEGSKKAIEFTGQMLRALAPGLRRIVTPIREYRKKPFAFWMDTLCVPLEQPYRSLAISRMKDVYAKATMTVVLDSELQAFEFRGSSNEELALRMGQSGWMRRAWTFQEGALSTQWLRFLFKDGPTKLPLWKKEPFSGPSDYLAPKTFDNMAKLQERLLEWSSKKGGASYWPTEKIPQSRLDEMAQAKKSYSATRHLLEETKNFFLGMKMLWEFVTPTAPPGILTARMIAVWNSMRLRATSRESDKFICFAMACAVGNNEREQLQKLLACPPEDRMREWVRSQPAVPSGLAFIPGVRYEAPGSRWIPRAVWPVAMEDEGVAVRDSTTGAFIFQKPGFITTIHKELLSGSDFVVSDSATELRYSVTFLEVPPTKVIDALGDSIAVAVMLAARVGHRPPEEGLVDVGLFIEEQESDVFVTPGTFMADDQQWVIE